MIQLRVCVTSHIFASCYCDRIFPLSAALIVRYNLCIILSLQCFYDLCFMHVYLYSAAGKFSSMPLNTCYCDRIFPLSAALIVRYNLCMILSLQCFYDLCFMHVYLYSAAGKFSSMPLNTCYCDRIFPLSAALIVRYNLCMILSLQCFYDLCFMHVYLYSAAGKFSSIPLNTCYCDRIFPLSAALIVRYNLCMILSLQCFYDLCFMHVYLYSAAGKFSSISLNTAMKDSILNESKLTVSGIDVGKFLSTTTTWKAMI